MLYLVAYDIPSGTKAGARRRKQLHDLLLDFGRPVQYSVFECDLDPRRRARLDALWRNIVDPKLDRLALYPICEKCASRAEFHGPLGPLLDL